MPLAPVALSDVLAALSRGLDLAGGRVPGHAVRTCLLAIRIAEEAGLDAREQAALRDAALLKDAGWSAVAGSLADLMEADELAVKTDLATTSWRSPLGAAVLALRHAGRDLPLSARWLRVARVLRGGRRAGREVYRVKCERAGGVVHQLGLSVSTGDAVQALDERWDGRGWPDGRSGTAVPVPARILGLAQAVETSLSIRGREKALSLVRRRRGSWFDPDLADLVLGWAADLDWWDHVLVSDDPAAVAARDPESTRMLDPDGLDHVALVFGEIADGKSLYTRRHSLGVAALATGVARHLGLDSDAERLVYRAGLLHEIGELAISGRLLDKPGAFTRAERASVETHPLHTWEILSASPALQDVARAAACHHERLDGSGYPWGLDARQLDLPSRILAVADMFEALTAERPFRWALPRDTAMACLYRDAGTRLDRAAVDALDSVVRRAHFRGRSVYDSLPDWAPLAV